jgi:hypothetical protein
MSPSSPIRREETTQRARELRRGGTRASVSRLELALCDSPVLRELRLAALNPASTEAFVQNDLKDVNRSSLDFLRRRHGVERLVRAEALQNRRDRLERSRLLV